jgi:hypothetical protein
MEARLLPMGASALLVEVADTDAALTLRARLAPLVGELVEHLVVGARTVLVVLGDAGRRDEVGRACLELAADVDAVAKPDETEPV